MTHRMRVKPSHRCLVSRQHCGRVPESVLAALFVALACSYSTLIVLSSPAPSSMYFVDVEDAEARTCVLLSVHEAWMKPKIAASGAPCRKSIGCVQRQLNLETAEEPEALENHSVPCFVFV